MPPGLSTRASLPKPGLEVGEVSDAEADGGRVELAVRERERQRVALDPLDRAGLPPRSLEHPRREVEPDDAAPAPLRRDRKVAGAATRVEHAVARPDDLGDGELAPALVEADGHDPVHQVVDRRDAVEHAAHGLGSERAGLVGHDESPQRGMRALSMPIWSRQRATTKSTRSSIDSAPW